MALDSDLTWRQSLDQLPNTSLFRRLIFSRDWLQPARMSLLAAATFLRVATLLLLWLPFVAGQSGMKVFAEPSPYFLTRLLAVCLVPMAVHMLTGAMTGRIFWGLVGFSALGRLAFAAGLISLLATWRKETLNAIDPLVPAYAPLTANATTMSPDAETDSQHSTFIWMYVMAVLVMLSGFHSVYYFFVSRGTGGLGAVHEWGERSAGNAVEIDDRVLNQSDAPDAADLAPLSGRTDPAAARQRAAALNPFSFEFGITPDPDDPLGMRTEDDIETEERAVLAAGNVAVIVRKHPISISQLLYCATSAAVGLGMLAAPGDWLVPGDAASMPYLIDTAAARRGTAFMLRLIGLVKLTCCFYPVVVVAEDGRLRSIFNARGYTITSLIPACLLAGLGQTYTGFGWGTGFLLIVDELVGLLLTVLEMGWSIRRWMLRQKFD